MPKLFMEWSAQKTNLQETKDRVFFHEREVWFASVGVNLGFEQDGKGGEFLRPVLVIKKFTSEMCWVVPTTKKDKQGKYYFSFSYKTGEVTSVILSQMRLVDSKRLRYKIGTASATDFREIKKRLISFLK